MLYLQFLFDLSARLFMLKVPKSYCCSITNQIMVDPVFTADGHTYEKEAIEEWLKGHDTSPKTGLQLINKQLIPNWDKKSDIKDFLELHPEFYKTDEIYQSKSLGKQIENLNRIEALECMLKEQKKELLLLKENLKRKNNIDHAVEVNEISKARDNWCQTQAAYRKIATFGCQGSPNNGYKEHRFTYVDYLYYGNNQREYLTPVPEHIKLARQQLAQEARERFPSPLPLPRP